VFQKFVVRLLVNAFAIAVIITLLPQGIRIEGADEQDRLFALLAIALIFGLVNAVVKPLLTLLACSLVVFTLGLFLLVINGAMLMLTAEISRLLPLPGRLVVDGFGWAVVGALLMSVIGMVTEHVLGFNDSKRVRTVREVRYVVREYPERPTFPPENGQEPPTDDRPRRG
jgi:putative membrane protein